MSTSSETTEIPEPKRYVFDIVYNRASRWFAVFILVLSFVLPPKGVGFSICWFNNLFEKPCPGCGLTRSVTNISHLDFSTALDYHPFGPLIYVVVLLLAGSNLLSQARIRKVRAWFIERERSSRWVYWTLIGVFLTYGFARLGYYCATDFTY